MERSLGPMNPKSCVHPPLLQMLCFPTSESSALGLRRRRTRECSSEMRFGSIQRRAALVCVTFAMSVIVQVASAQTFGVFRELWRDLSTNDFTLNSLTNRALNPRWPDSPNVADSKVKASLESDVSSLEGYGQRLRGFLVPPTTGDYRFWIESEDASVLLLSQDESLAKMRTAASVLSGTRYREWTKEPNQKSELIPFEQGRRYYIEVLHKASRGGNHLSVRWQLPNGDFEEPITNSPASTRLIPYRVLDGRSVQLTVLSTNQGPVQYQWRLAGVDLPESGASKSVLTIPRANTLTHNNQSYSCVLTTAAGSITSSIVGVTVLVDVTPPTMTGVVSAGLGFIRVTFSEPVEPALALDISHYSLTPLLQIISIQTIDAQTFQLAVSPMLEGQAYSLSVRGVSDLATPPNLISPGLAKEFFAHELNSTDVGRSSPPGSAVKDAGGWTVSGGGSGLQGKSDQFQFESQRRSGDFDLRVRISAFESVDLWSRCGLMARETLDGASRFAAVVTSSGIAGSMFVSRAQPGTSASSVGSFPANFPFTWLRLKRVGSLVEGFAGHDGEYWATLGQGTLSAGTVFVGLAVAAHNTNAVATAEFREFGPVTGTPGVQTPIAREPLGPSSRKTGMVISEIMYKPAPQKGTNVLEVVELELSLREGQVSLADEVL